MTTLEQSKPADEARDLVLRSGSVSSCNDLLHPVAVLCCSLKSVYHTLPNVECYDKNRDVRRTVINQLQSVIFDGWHRAWGEPMTGELPDASTS